MINLGTEELLISEEIMIRRFVISDAESMIKNWASDESVTEYLTWEAYADIKIARKRISAWLRQYSNKQFYQWAIVYMPIHEAIGSISAYSRDDSIEISYCLGKEFWNKGIMTKVLSGVIAFFKECVLAEKIYVEIAEYNYGSQKLALKCGMKREESKITYANLTSGRTRMIWYSC